MQDDQRRSALGEIDLLGLPITEFLTSSRMWT